MYPHLMTPIGYQTLLFAAFFHDVGKLEELGLHPVTGDVFYTDRGQRFGHILLGRDMLLDAAARAERARESWSTGWTSSSWATKAKKSGTRCASL